MSRRFTLIEVTVALALLLFMGTIVLGTLSGTFRLRDYLEAADDTDRSARVAIQRITRELRLAYLTANTTTPNTYRTVFVGKDGNDTDQVWFATLAHHRQIRDSRECDQSEITLWTEESEDRDATGLVLYHREAPRIDQEPAKDGVILPLATGLMAFDLRYLDGERNEWAAQWDSTRLETTNRLPRAAELRLVLLAPDPDDDERQVERTYLTTVLLDLAAPLQRSLLSEGGGA